MFFIELDGHKTDKNVDIALKNITTFTKFKSFGILSQRNLMKKTFPEDRVNLGVNKITPINLENHPIA